MTWTVLWSFRHWWHCQRWQDSTMRPARWMSTSVLPGNRATTELASTNRDRIPASAAKITWGGRVSTTTLAVSSPVVTMATAAIGRSILLADCSTLLLAVVWTVFRESHAKRYLTSMLLTVILQMFLASCHRELWVIWGYRWTFLVGYGATSLAACWAPRCHIPTFLSKFFSNVFFYKRWWRIWPHHHHHHTIPNMSFGEGQTMLPLRKLSSIKLLLLQWNVVEQLNCYKFLVIPAALISWDVHRFKTLFLLWWTPLPPQQAF